MVDQVVEGGGVAPGWVTEGGFESGWEDRAAGWVRAGSLVVAAGVVLAWGASMVVPMASGPASERVALEAEKNRKKTQDCVDCGGGCEALDCIDCGCELADCGGCDGLDCGGLDCGGLDCGGCDVACAVAPGTATAGGSAPGPVKTAEKVGRAGCRRGPPAGSALALGAPLVLLAAWRRKPGRSIRRSGAGQGAGGPSS